MPFREGDVYRCPDQACGCELTGTKGSPRPCSGQQIPTCCCGKTLVKKSE